MEYVAYLKGAILLYGNACLYAVQLTQEIIQKMRTHPQYRPELAYSDIHLLDRHQWHYVKNNSVTKLDQRLWEIVSNKTKILHKVYINKRIFGRKVFCFIL